MRKSIKSLIHQHTEKGKQLTWSYEILIADAYFERKLVPTVRRLSLSSLCFFLVCSSYKAALAFQSSLLTIFSPLICFHVANSDHTNELFCIQLIKSNSHVLVLYRGLFKVSSTVQLTYLCRGHGWSDLGFPQANWATPDIQSQLVRGWSGSNEQLALSH